jgi:hypothetical protein
VTSFVAIARDVQPKGYEAAPMTTNGKSIARATALEAARAGRLKRAASPAIALIALVCALRDRGKSIMGQRQSGRPPMKSAIIVATLAGSLVFAQPQAFAAPRWTFCVASAQGARDVWITNVFAASASRQRLEAGLKRALERQGRKRVDAQCPQPSADKVAVVNAQTTAEEFNRKLGAVLHDLPARLLEPRGPAHDAPGR